VVGRKIRQQTAILLVLTGSKEKFRLRSIYKHTLKENCPPPWVEHYRSPERTDGYSAGEFCARDLSAVKKLSRLFKPECNKGSSFPTAGN